MPPTPKILAAADGDVPLLLSMVRELAEFEQRASQVVASEEALHRALFGPHPACEAALATCDAQPVGFVLYFFTFSTFAGRANLYIEDLFVRPTQRRQGVGRALMSYLARVALQRDCARLEWSVLHGNEPALKFYSNLGATPVTEWAVYKLAGAALEQLADSTAG